MQEILRALRWIGIFVFCVMLTLTIREFIPRADNDQLISEAELRERVLAAPNGTSASAVSVKQYTNTGGAVKVSRVDMSITIKRQNQAANLRGASDPEVKLVDEAKPSASRNLTERDQIMQMVNFIRRANASRRARIAGALAKLVDPVAQVRAQSQSQNQDQVVKPSLSQQRLEALTRPNVYIEGMEIVRSTPGQNCVNACEKFASSVTGPMYCEEEALMFGSFDTCENMKRWLPCKQCVEGLPPGTKQNDTSAPGRKSYAPYIDEKTGLCVANGAGSIWHPERPKCDTFASGLSRMCVCLPKGMYNPAKTNLGDEGILSPVKQVAEGRMSFGRALPLAFPNITCPCNPSSTTFTPITDLACRAYLSNADNIDRLVFMKSNTVDARTIKWKAHYKHCGIKALIKAPQASFSWEAVNEMACYHLDRWMDLRMIPPTQLIHLPISYLRASMADTPVSHQKWVEKDCFQHSLGRRFNFTDRIAKENDVLTLTAQLFLNNITPFHVSIFDLPKNYERLLTAGASVTEGINAVSVPLVNITLAQTADTAVFDYILGNIDRNRIKNFFVAGGCLHTIDNCTEKGEHVGVPRIVLLDQGWSFYSGNVPPWNPLNPQNEFKWDMCRFTKEMANFIMHAEGLEAEDPMSRALKERGATTLYYSNTITEMVSQNIPEAVLKALPIARTSYQVAHLRLRDIAKRIAECEAKFGRAETRYFDRYPYRSLTDEDSIYSILTTEQTEAITQYVYEREVKPWEHLRKKK